MKKKTTHTQKKFLDKSIDILYNIIIKNSNKRSDKTMATANYTEQQTKEMVAQYEAAPTKETVEAIAENLAKTLEALSLNCPEKVSTRHNQELLNLVSL